MIFARSIKSLLTLMLTLSIAGATRAPQRAAETPNDYFAVSSEDFAKLPAANRDIDFQNVDQRLMSAAILHATNAYRAQSKLRPLQHLDELDTAAMIHVNDMVEKSYLAHEEKNTKTPHPIDRVRAAGLKPMLVAENLAIAFGIRYEGGRKVYPLSQWRREGLSYTENGPAIPPHSYQSFATALVKQWWESPDHKKNIQLPDARYMGHACLPQKPARDGSDADFHKFYCAQEFFTPMRK